MPSTEELKALRDILLKHALGMKLGPQPRTRQQQVFNYVMGRQISEGERCGIVTAQEIEENCPSAEATKPHEAVHNVTREIRKKLNKFYDNLSKGVLVLPDTELPRYRAIRSKAIGNYAYSFLAFRLAGPKADFVRAFWRPHLPPQGTAKILFVEPLFMMDERRTFFRNRAMGTRSDDVSALSYLNISGTLKPGYSYVPAGVVQAMLLITEAIRGCDNQSPNVPSYEALKSSDAKPPATGDLIILATPTSTKLALPLQRDRKWRCEADGIHYGSRVLIDNEEEQWGLVTRMEQSYRTVTLFLANHGRSVEEMARFLTKQEPLALLADKASGLANRKEFQVLFRMSVASTDEGPLVQGATIEDTLN